LKQTGAFRARLRLVVNEVEEAILLVNQTPDIGLSSLEPHRKGGAARIGCVRQLAENVYREFQGNAERDIAPAVGPNPRRWCWVGRRWVKCDDAHSGVSKFVTFETGKEQDLEEFRQASGGRRGKPAPP
jgi:hypothetical protein